MEAHLALVIDIDVGHAAEDLFERNLAFHAGQRSAETKVRAVAKR
jgi:hypothetical protein